MQRKRAGCEIIKYIFKTKDSRLSYVIDAKYMTS
nr:MAG TPA: hypothetical protein [Caudoviricetes sp.]